VDAGTALVLAAAVTSAGGIGAKLVKSGQTKTKKAKSMAESLLEGPVSGILDGYNEMMGNLRTENARKDKAIEHLEATVASNDKKLDEVCHQLDEAKEEIENLTRLVEHMALVQEIPPEDLDRLITEMQRHPWHRTRANDPKDPG
jgi:uncharacterized coiled-coil protein SlyX